MIEPSSNESDHRLGSGSQRRATMHDRPTAAELLAAIADTLDNRVLPAVDASARHDVRVAANLCRILRRELAESSLDRDLADEVRELVAAETGVPNPPDAGPQLLDALCRLIDQPELSEQAEAEARRVTKEMVEAKLAVAQPGYGTANPASTANPPSPTSPS